MSKINKYLTDQDLNRIKGALRRVFARSEHANAVSREYAVKHMDDTRPRCKKWSWCASCGQVIPTWTTELDHKEPVVPIQVSYIQFVKLHGIDGLIDQLWCHPSNLQRLCEPCHKAKSKAENTQRPKKKGKKK